MKSQKRSNASASNQFANVTLAVAAVPWYDFCRDAAWVLILNAGPCRVGAVMGQGETANSLESTASVPRVISPDDGGAV